MQSEFTYLHYSDKKIDILHDTKQETKIGYNFSLKPKGLWLSYGNEWNSWCIDNDFSTCNMSNCYIYGANIDKSKIFVISSFENLKDLHDKYEKNIYSEFYYIDWYKVSENYDGICFQNYHKIKSKIYLDAYYKYSWFLGVDINSVCLWRPNNALKEWKLIKNKINNENIKIT